MSVSSCIEESMNFIEAAGYMSAAIANQSQVIIATIEKNRGGSSIQDSTQALQLLNSNRASKAFQTNARQSMIEKIVNCGSESSESKIDQCAGKTVTITVQQQNRHIENYLTQEDWDEIDRFHRGTIKSDQIMRRMAIRSGAIRMWNPRESVGARIAAIVAAEMESMPAGETLYAWARSYKNWLVAYRKKNRVIIAGPSEYPEDAVSFAALNPGMYAPNRPPVVCRIDTEKLEAAVACTVMRSTNRRSLPSQSIIASRTIAPAGGQDIASQSIRMLLDFMQRPQQSDQLQIDLTPPPKRTKTDGRLLALENGSITPPAIVKPAQSKIDEDIAGESSDSEGGDEPSIDAMIKRTNTVIDTAKESRKKSNAKKRPASSINKRPAASTTTSVIECKTCPSMPSITANIGSLMWKGCKIQSNPNNRKWRVFPKPDKYMYDKGFPWGADPNAAWKSVLAYCNNPVLPEGTKPRA